MSHQPSLKDLHLPSLRNKQIFEIKEWMNFRNFMEGFLLI